MLFILCDAACGTEGIGLLFVPLAEALSLLELKSARSIQLDRTIGSKLRLRLITMYSIV